MSFHFPTPFRSRLRRRPRVIDESGQPVGREPLRNLDPVGPTPLAQRRHAYVDPAELPTARQPRVSEVVASPPPTWEQRLEEMARFWDSVEGRLGKLAEYVSGKSKFDIEYAHNWSEHLRTRRVKGDRRIDAQLLEERYVPGGTQELAGLQRQIRERILADALAATAVV